MLPQSQKPEVITKGQKQQIRKDLLDFEAMLKEQDGVLLGDNELCPLKHSFTDGIYVREIFIPEGMVLTGKIHKHAHPNFLMSGTVEVVTEEGRQRLTGPLSMISPPGTKRALIACSDLVWITCHHNPTNTQDLAKLEKIVIADSYEKYERFRKLQDNKIVKFITKLKKLCLG